MYAIFWKKNNLFLSGDFISFFGRYTHNWFEFQCLFETYTCTCEKISFSSICYHHRFIDYNSLKVWSTTYLMPYIWHTIPSYFHATLCTNKFILSIMRRTVHEESLEWRVPDRLRKPGLWRPLKYRVVVEDGLWQQRCAISGGSDVTKIELARFVCPNWVRGGYCIIMDQIIRKS